MMEDTDIVPNMDSGPGLQQGPGSQPKFELKTIHIVVMVITLLHAVAIAIWVLVFLASSKGMLFVSSVRYGATIFYVFVD